MSDVLLLIAGDELAEHCIGYDRAQYPYLYIRHGKKFYKPYRNYFSCNKKDRIWEELKDAGYADSWSEEDYGTTTYFMTRKGLDWLGNYLDVIIRDCK